jgi:hypothetical protein
VLFALDLDNRPERLAAWPQLTLLSNQPARIRAPHRDSGDHNGRRS